MDVKNTASALGEAIGKIIENELESTLRPICEKFGYIYDRGGERPGKRKGIKLSMVNRSGISYQLDAVIETPGEVPIVLIESKYLRYKKHNRDKASWTCASHYRLRKTYPSIRKSIAVLSGNWSEPSKRFMESFGIELYEISFHEMCSILGEFKIQFDWDEKDKKTPDLSWSRFKQFTDAEKKEIGRRLIAPIREVIVSSVKLTLQGGEDWIKRLSEIEVLLQTERNEFFNYTFKTTQEAIKFLVDLQMDVPDLRDRLKR